MLLASRSDPRVSSFATVHRDQNFASALACERHRPFGGAVTFEEIVVCAAQAWRGGKVSAEERGGRVRAAGGWERAMAIEVKREQRDVKAIDSRNPRRARKERKRRACTATHVGAETRAETCALAFTPTPLPFSPPLRPRLRARQ
eukprot:2352309-Pleurochrysis_carterae.AAC.1